jgi:hypothetical protein
MQPPLNLSERRWVEYVADDEFGIDAFGEPASTLPGAAFDHVRDLARTQGLDCLDLTAPGRTLADTRRREWRLARFRLWTSMLFTTGFWAR